MQTVDPEDATGRAGTLAFRQYQQLGLTIPLVSTGANIVAAFFVRVIPSLDGIANAAQTLGQRTLHPDALRELVEDKFVDALRSTAATMTMQQLQDERPNFVQGVQNAVSEDLTKNGLELESVSLTSLDQTGKDYFNPNNAFDAEGLTRLTQETENRRRQRNEIEQDTEVSVRQKNLDAEKMKHSRVKVMNADRVFDDVVTVVVGLAVFGASLETTAGYPDTGSAVAK